MLCKVLAGIIVLVAETSGLLFSNNQRAIPDVSLNSKLNPLLVFSKRKPLHQVLALEISILVVLLRRVYLKESFY